LPVLHAIHDRDGYLSDDAIRVVSKGLKIPLAELFATVTFYHHFSRSKPGKSAPRVCTGNVCCLNGGKEILEALESEGSTPMPCSGRCDDMVPVLRGDQVFVGPNGEITAGDNEGSFVRGSTQPTANSSLVVFAVGRPMLPSSAALTVFVSLVLSTTLQL